MALSAFGNTPALEALVTRLRASGTDIAHSPTLDGVAPAALAATVIVHVEGRVPAALAQLPQPIAGRLVLFVDEINSETEADLLSFPTTLAAMICKQGALTVDEMELAVQNVIESAPLGLARYLPGATLAPPIILSKSSERGAALTSLETFVAGLSLERRRLAQILTVADELITNAFYHAPVDGIGGHPYSHVSRMDLLQTAYNHDIVLVFGHNERSVGVAVRDTYGSLEQPQIRSHLAKAVTNVNANFRVSGGVGGAKLGLITAMRAVSQLIFDVVPLELTDCIGIIDTAGTYRQFAEAGKSLQLFSRPEAQKLLH